MASIEERQALGAAPYVPSPHKGNWNGQNSQNIQSRSQPQQYGNLDNFMPPPPFSRRWHIAKIALGGASIVCSTVLICLGIAIATVYASTDVAYIDLILAACTAGIALAWQIAENITICARSVHRGIHPGAHVALHLIIWLLAALSTAFVAVFLSGDVPALYENPGSNCDPNDIECYSNDASSYSGDSLNDLSTSDIRTYIGIESALLAFFFILTVIHFVLFVRACVETSQRNKMPKTVVLMPQGTQLPASNSQFYYMPVPSDMAHMSYMQSRPQPMQQMQPLPPQSVYPAQAPGQGNYTPAAAAPQHAAEEMTATDPNVYGYYTPAPAQQHGFPYMPDGSGSQSRPESSVIAPSPLSEARQLDKGKGPEIVTEQGEASGSGSHAL